MTCDACGAALHPPTRGTWEYKCGLPSVRLLDVEVSRCSRCDNAEVAIPDVHGLHAALAEAVALKPLRLSGAEIRFLRKYLGWSGADAAANLGASAETLSRWEHEHLTMPQATERLLRVLAVSERPVEFYREVLRLPKTRAPVGERYSASLSEHGWRTSRLQAEPRL